MLSSAFGRWSHCTELINECTTSPRPILVSIMHVSHSNISLYIHKYIETFHSRKFILHDVETKTKYRENACRVTPVKYGACGIHNFIWLYISCRIVTHIFSYPGAKYIFKKLDIAPCVKFKLNVLYVYRYWKQINLQHIHFLIYQKCSKATLSKWLYHSPWLRGKYGEGREAPSSRGSRCSSSPHPVSSP